MADTEYSKKNLPQVTLIGIDCVDLGRLKLAAEICERGFTFSAVKLLSSIPDTDPRVIPIPPITSTVAYSAFCIEELWKYIDTDYVLVFQGDGFILNPSAWSEDFLHYDYIGAPWYYLPRIAVGNGGFSLRSKRLMDLIGRNYEKIGGTFHPEDSWICIVAKDFLEKHGIVFAPLEVAQRFSTEGAERGVYWNGEFGFHGLKYTDISRWLEKNPEYQTRLAQTFDDFTEFMRKYPVYDGTVHVLRSKPLQVEHYAKLSRHQKDYDCRLDGDLVRLDPILPSHSIVYRLFRISVAQVGIPTFERSVKKVEKFPSKHALLQAHPEIEITPSFFLPKWRQYLVRLFGTVAFPSRASYTLIWFV